MKKNQPTKLQFLVLKSNMNIFRYLVFGVTLLSTFLVLDGKRKLFWSFSGVSFSATSISFLGTFVFFKPDRNSNICDAEKQNFIFLANGLAFYFQNFWLLTRLSIGFFKCYRSKSLELITPELSSVLLEMVRLFSLSINTQFRFSSLRRV